MDKKNKIAPNTGAFFNDLLGIVKFSADELGQMVGLDRTTINRKITGEANLSLEHFFKLTKGLRKQLPHKAYNQLIKKYFIE